MRLVFELLTVAVMFCLSGAPALAENTPQSPCDGIRFGFHESIASQGFLGALTPKADAAVVKKGLESALIVRQYHAEAQGESEANHDFYWPAVCRMARERKATVLWIACSADTAEDSGQYYAASLASSTDKVGKIMATCLVSTYNGSKSPSWDDLRKTALLHPFTDQRNIYPSSSAKDGDRYDQLQKKDVRAELYAQVIRGIPGLIELAAGEHYAKSHAAFSTGGVLGALSGAGEPDGGAHCGGGAESAPNPLAALEKETRAYASIGSSCQIFP